MSERGANKRTPPPVPPAPVTRDTTLRWAVRLLYAEAAVTGVITLLAVWAAITSSRVTTQSAIATAAFAALCVAVFGGLAFALSRRKSLARSPAIVLEMLLIPMGWTAASAGLPIVGIPAFLAGLFGAGLLLAPSTRFSLGATRRS